MAKLLRLAGLGLLALCALCLTSTNLLGQTDLGAVRGHVRDQQNRAVSGATVTLNNTETAYERTVQTDSSGNYSFIGVPLTGTYVLKVSAAQFQAVEQQNIRLRAAGTAVFDFTLAVSGE